MRAAGLLVLMGVLLIPLFALFPVVDYSFYSSVTRAWMSNSIALYSDEAFGFFYAPWALALTVPLTFLPDQLAQALLNFISLLGLWAATWMLTRPRSAWEMVPAVLNPFAGWVFLLGQWDALVLTGIGLSWLGVTERRPLLLGGGLVLATTKPTNVWLVVVLLLWATRGWSSRKKVLSLVPLMIAVASSFIVAGWDWPLRYLSSVSSAPPHGFDVSLFGTDYWPVQVVVGLAMLSWLVWLAGKKVRGSHILLALAGNPLMSPYLVHYHLVTVGPAVVGVIQKSRWIGASLWLLSFPLYWAFHTRWQPHLVLLFPFLVFAALAWPLTVEKVKTREAVRSSSD
ncbi:MAG: DUF2029 domain-containing protein [Gemmatimonadetes bacterium]|nr:DUF2029 domain-containing protein [Gemmatimonadota bacterium]NNM03903.1 DUF2029 domain-containing protein [Gemmatimonadota bacterium]